MTELKTLNDLEEGKYAFKGLVQLRHVKDEAIKWVKKDIQDVQIISSHGMLKRWMERLNITEEDLE